MSFRPCFLVPVYNHGRTVTGIVAALAIHGLPVFIVDDGSNHDTQQALAEVARRYPLVRLLRLPANRGKGAAVIRAMREARAAGHTHGLQIDADGQHDTGAVAHFLEAAAAEPEALVLGVPGYDTTVPRLRLYARYLTHVWVWIETLSFDIRDSMCGFRVYPLESTCRLIDSVAVAERMAFDTEIAVRLAWRGVPLVNIPIRVTYPAGGVSHFRMVQDNAIISWTHTKLVIGMLLRLPWLIGRKLAGRRDPGRHWSRVPERGSEWGLRSVLFTYRVLGYRAASWLIWPIVIYFHTTGRAARAASRQYLERLATHAARLGEPLAGEFGSSLHHMREFALSGLDKLAAWSGQIGETQVRFPQREAFDRLMASGRGALFVGAHLGNLEMSRALARSAGRATINAIVFTEHARRFNDLLASANEDFHINLIQVSDLGPDTAILLEEKIGRGEHLVIVGDRTPPSGDGRVTSANFLGHPAPFAQGPWILAAALRCPVYLFFCLREAAGRYCIYFEPFAERIELPRLVREKILGEVAGRFAGRLEAYCRLAPYQWFNFFDFWAERSQK